jgi:hypothetical protein
LQVEVRAEDSDDAYSPRRPSNWRNFVPDYTGPSNPPWDGYSDFARLFSDAPASASAADVVADLGLVPPKTLTGAARDLILAAASALLRELKQQTPPAAPDKIGRLDPSTRTDPDTNTDAASASSQPAGTCRM